MKRLLGWLSGAVALGAVVGAITKRAEPERLPSEDVAGPADPAASAEPAPLTAGAVGERRWLYVLVRLRERLSRNHTAIIAGSLAYYAMLSIFPAAIAAVAIYGLVLDPSELANQVAAITDALPEDAASIVTEQLNDIVAGSGGGLGVAAAISIVAALWSASAGTKALITGINIAYGVDETRKFIALRGLALLITLGMVVFIAGAIATLTFVPELPVIGDRARGVIQILRFPVIFGAVVVGLSVLYRIAPNRPAHPWRMVLPGALVAAVLWLVATVGFTAYVNNLGNFNATYGALGGVIVLLLWFFLSGFIVLLGAELNAELEAEAIAQAAAAPAS